MKSVAFVIFSLIYLFLGALDIFKAEAERSHTRARTSVKQPRQQQKWGAGAPSWPQARSQYGAGGGGQPPILDFPGSDCNRNTFNLTFHLSPRSYMTTAQIAESYGFPTETHTVTTKGYILTIHRIPHGAKDTKSRDNFPVDQAGSTRPVVLLWHGMTGNSASFVFLGEDSLALNLANAGYDVWMANTRGNRFADKHKKMNVFNPKFWSWSFDELAKYDVPKVINYILNVTGEPKLYYSGHSMGGTLFFMAMIVHPELNGKIRSFYGLAPACYLQYVHTPIVLLAPLEPILEILYSLIGWGSVAPPFIINPLVNTLGPPVCAPSGISATLCAFFVYLIAGINPCQLNSTGLAGMMAGSGLDTISIRCLRHYIQMVYTKRFCAFDHGPTENQKRYGQRTAPDYDTRKITAKVAIFYGNNDFLVTPKDTERLLRELPNVIYSRLMPYPLWNHLDFISGIDARRLIYEPMMRLMAQHY